MVRVIHILADAYYIYDPFRREEISFASFQNNREAFDKYLQTSKQMKHEFFKLYCDMLPPEIRIDLEKVPLFPSLSPFSLSPSTGESKLKFSSTPDPSSIKSFPVQGVDKNNVSEVNISLVMN